MWLYVWQVEWWPDPETSRGLQKKKGTSEKNRRVFESMPKNFKNITQIVSCPYDTIERRPLFNIVSKDEIIQEDNNVQVLYASVLEYIFCAKTSGTVCRVGLIICGKFKHEMNKK